MLRFFFILSIIFASFSLKAQDAYIDAIGLRGGPLAGVTYKRFVWPLNGVIEGIAGFNFLNDRSYSFTGLYEYHMFINYNLNFFAGGGTSLAFNKEDFRWMAEGIVGIEYMLDTMPLLLCVDYKPAYSVLSKEFVFTEAALSVRYILNK